jgi:hypothetical protein
MKNYKYTSKLTLWVEFCSEFFVVNDIEIHQLNLRPLKSLKFLVKIHSKMCFLALVEQHMDSKLLFLGKNHYLKKKEDILQDGIILIFHFSLVW